MQSKGPSGTRGLRLLWGVESRGRRGPEARYTIQDVARAAVVLADRSGLAAVTLGAVAAELGLTTTALYRYVDTKDVLVEIMVDGAVGRAPRLTGATWRDRAAQWAEALAARYAAHPWLADVRASGLPRRPGTFAWLDALLAAVEGEADVDGMRLGLLLDAVVRGFAVVQVDPDVPPDWLGPVVAQRYPRLAGELRRDWADIEAELRAAVAVVLRGMSARGRREAS